MSVELDIKEYKRFSDDEINYDFIIVTINKLKKLDYKDPDSLWIILSTLIRGGVRKIAIDMQFLQFIDSSGIAIIINATKIIRSNHGDIVLLNVTDELKDILKIINFGRFVQMFDDERAVSEFFKLV